MELSKRTLNSGLSFSMEFGKNWLVDIQERLLNENLELTTLELDFCNKLCKKVNKCAHDYVSKNPIKGNKEISFMEFSQFAKFIKSKYEWIDDENLSHLYNQSCYYALK